MVIFGAGASYDSSSNVPITIPRPNRPALADNLFEERSEFRSARTEFREFHDLIPQLLPKNPRRSLEEVLQRLQDQGADNPRRRQQLTAVKYYLQSIFQSTIPIWLSGIGGFTNYEALLDRVRHFQKVSDPVCLVTFNYDTLLETALSKQYGVEFHVMNDYIGTDGFKLFKLHGSQNWGRHISSAPQVLFSTQQGPFGHSHKIIEHIDRISLTNSYSLVTEQVAQGYSATPLVPAIAIPIANKDDSTFECPTDHLGQLANLIPKVTRVLTIGWRGREQHFLNMLKDLRAISLASIGGDLQGSEEPLNHMKTSGIQVLDFLPFAGFSDTIGESAIDKFLAN
jgi:hypothetical protein